MEPAFVVLEGHGKYITQDKIHICLYTILHYLTVFCPLLNIYIIPCTKGSGISSSSSVGISKDVILVIGSDPSFLRFLCFLSGDIGWLVDPFGPCGRPCCILKK